MCYTGARAHFMRYIFFSVHFISFHFYSIQRDEKNETLRMITKKTNDNEKNENYETLRMITKKTKNIENYEILRKKGKCC